MEKIVSRQTFRTVLLTMMLSCIDSLIELSKVPEKFGALFQYSEKCNTKTAKNIIENVSRKLFQNEDASIAAAMGASFIKTERKVEKFFMMNKFKQICSITVNQRFDRFRRTFSPTTFV